MISLAPAADKNVEEVKRSFLAELDIDPITFSVILNRFSTIAREMTLTLEYTSWTSILAVARDFSCAIYDAQPRQVCMEDALPIHTNSLHVILKSMVKAFDGNVYDGDVIVSNYPYAGNTQVILLLPRLFSIKANICFGQ